MCYAIHLGGTFTLVGTTTNLTVASLLSKNLCRNLSIFQLTQVGLPTALAGIGFLLLFSPLVMPDNEEFARRTALVVDVAEEKRRKHRRRGFVIRGMLGVWDRIRGHGSQRDSIEVIEVARGRAAKATDYVFHAYIPQGSHFHQKTVEASNLHHLDGLFLASVQRGNKVFSAVGPDLTLLEGDDLGFAGDPNRFLPLCKERGLNPVIEGDSISADAENPLAASLTLRAVISSTSDLSGKTFKEVGFRTKNLFSNTSTPLVHDMILAINVPSRTHLVLSKR